MPFSSVFMHIPKALLAAEYFLFLCHFLLITPNDPSMVPGKTPLTNSLHMSMNFLHPQDAYIVYWLWFRVVCAPTPHHEWPGTEEGLRAVSKVVRSLARVGLGTSPAGEMLGPARACLEKWRAGSCPGLPQRHRASSRDGQSHGIWLQPANAVGMS